MHSSLFTEISTLIALGASIALLMRLLRQPLIIGHIITGIIAGPSLLNIIHADTSFSGLSSMGVALLLFIIGLDLSVKIFSRLGRVVFITAGAQIIGITAAGFLAAERFGFNRTESFLIGLALSLSSTIIIVKLFNDKSETTRLYAQITIGVLLLQDVVATVAKIGLATRAGGGDSTTVLLELLLKGGGLILVLYIFGHFIIPTLNKTMESSKELLLLFALGWGLGFATLFEMAGFSIETGALFAGVSLASLPYSSEMVSRLRPIRDFFLVIFFITLGQSMAPGRLAGVMGVAAVFCLIVLVLKPLVVMMTMGGLGYTKNASFKAAVSMSQVSEFSLVLLLAAAGFGMVGERAITTVTLVAFITFGVSTYLIKYDKTLFSKFERYLRFFERKVTRYEQQSSAHRHSVLLFGYRKGGQEFVKVFKDIGKRFLVIDYDPEVIESLESQRIDYLYGDVTDVELLEEAGIGRVKLAISTISDHEANKFLLQQIEKSDGDTVFICPADRIERAAELYELGASYVILPHYIGSEKIGAFIKKSGFSKTEFQRFRDKHLAHLQSHYALSEDLPT